MRRHLLGAVALVLASWSCFQASAAEPLLREGDHVAVIGDSITEQRLYSMFIEDYLLMCKPAAGLRATQFGWGGETAHGFNGRMANDMLPFGATVATTCFGMNDGGYAPLDPTRAKWYRTAQKAIVDQLKRAKVRVIVVGSPGCVDADTYGRHNPQAAATYNQTLAQLRDIAREVAQQEGVVFADVHTPLFEAMNRAKAKYGKKYFIAADGVHPDRNGQLVMAYAFLKALGCDGQIGTITVDLASGKAEATDGHRVLGGSVGEVELESTKYPFCFYGDPSQPGSTRSLLEFVPFNDDLNRFRLIVRGLTSEKAKVTWGTVSREFPAAALAAGINLAAEFLDNPFSKSFQQVEAQVAKQQQMEVGLIKNAMHSLPIYRQLAPSEGDSLDRIAKTLLERDREARDASAAAVVPVRHRLKIEAVK